LLFVNRTCVWCKREWDDFDAAPAITGAACEECRAELLQPPTAQSLADYLDRLAVPVLVLADDVRVIGANAVARSVLGKDAATLTGCLPGDVIECAYAKLPGGCGNTEHCKACTIRQLVTGSHLTGASHRFVPAYQDIHLPGGVREMRYLVSTETAGPFVLLRIDEVRPA
jgi:hypothetical protein